MSKPQRPPLRLLFFSSESCKFCPHMEQILKKIIKDYYLKNVLLTTVDVDIQPETSLQFGVKNLPTILLGTGNIYETIAEGYVEQDTVKDRLMNRIFHSLIAGEAAQAKRKENLIWLTRNVINSVQKKVLIRPNIGDYVHLQALQITNMSLLALDPIASTLLYETGKINGMYGHGQMILFQINKKLAKQIETGSKFKQLIKTLVKFYSDMYFPLHLAESSTIISVGDFNATIRMFGSAYAVHAPNIGEPLCYSIAGEIAGLVQAIMAHHVRVEETTCWGMGNDYCEFSIELTEKDVASSRDVPSISGKRDVLKRRDQFITTLADMTEKHQDSLMFKKKMRTNEDFVHITVIQQAFTALKIIDPFCGMLLYSAGVTFGLTADKRIINKELTQAGQKIPLSLADAVKIIVKEFQHPTTLLTRQHSFVTLESYEEDDEEDSYYIIQIEELAYSAGATNVGQTYSDFVAGFINGRLQLLIQEDIQVIETDCFGTGSKHCRFKISLE